MNIQDDPESLVGLVKKERQRRISQIIMERGSVRASDLSEIFGVTDETIRRDLNTLAEAGVILRSHGGAVTALTRTETTLDRRLRENEAEKMVIGRAASELVANGSTIIIDSGSTTVHLATALRNKRDLVIITNAVTIASELLKSQDISVIFTGGVIRRTTFGAVGDLALSALRGLNVDQTFLAISAASIEHGLMYPGFEEVSVKQAMIEAASEVILLADHTKFGRKALVSVAPITAMSRIITDWGIDPEKAQEIRDQGVDLIIAPPLDEQLTNKGPMDPTSTH